MLIARATFARIFCQMKGLSFWFLFLFCISFAFGCKPIIDRHLGGLVPSLIIICFVLCFVLMQFPFHQKKKKKQCFHLQDNVYHSRDNVPKPDCIMRNSITNITNSRNVIQGLRDITRVHSPCGNELRHAPNPHFKRESNTTLKNTFEQP